MSNPVPPFGGDYPPPGQGQPGYPPAGGPQPGYPPAGQGQPGFPPPAQNHPGYPPAPQGQPAQPAYTPDGTQPAYPPAGAQPGFPPAGAQPGGAPQPGFPPPGAQPGGFPPPNAGGFPPPNSGEAPPNYVAFPVEKKSGGAGKVLLRVFGAIVVGIIVIALKVGIGSALFGGDDAKEAKAGDCISADTDIPEDKTERTQANVVDCADSDAAYSVVARVEGESDPKSTSCDKFFKEGERFLVLGSASDGGYLLCLRPTKAS
ncbi:LppU/SCO3897 family protein [Paractinoplanes atraurantiacus]|uniref:Uncharacterized protein n=1 Tax=Paractinoplanes atraurantiacus TaxID=1036182 RepID=A0A285IU60_9ACTN|nr:hypothetical protein [Actinoplanes atraurantiacus]SNY51522.1 hypothetical protein SAMN05421748_1124 [Actinoplanes atraurantiacus]